MQTRNKSFLLRLTEQEYAALRRKSELAGLKMNPFVVSLINGCEIHPRTPDSCKALSQHWVVPFKYTNGSGWDSNRDRFSNQCHIRHLRHRYMKQCVLF